MKLSWLSVALLGAGAANAVDVITTKGNKFFDSKGNQFFMKGMRSAVGEVNMLVEFSANSCEHRGCLPVDTRYVKVTPYRKYVTVLTLG